MLRREWQADRLVTSRDSDVGPARRAGLIVVRIGPRDPASAPSVERADHEARDLLDAVSRLMTADVFGELPWVRLPGAEPVKLGWPGEPCSGRLSRPAGCPAMTLKP